MVWAASVGEARRRTRIVVELFTRYRNTSALIVVLALQLALLAYQVKRGDDVRLLHVWTAAAIAPLQKAMSGASRFVASGWNDYVWLVDTRQENRQLRRQLDELKLENQRLQRSMGQFERGQVLQQYQESILSQTVISQVIGVGSNPNSKEIFLDLGTDAGVGAGMAVVTPDGIAGKVHAAHGGTSLVLLFNDPEAAVGVLLARSRARGVLKGTGSAFCLIDYVDRDVEVRIGEKVYTSGDDRIYPKGLLVGTVTRLEQASEFQRIYVKPAVPLNRLEEVLVITSGVHQQLPSSSAPQPPGRLLPPPPADFKPSNPVESGLRGRRTGGDAWDSYQTEDSSPDAVPRATDADRLKRRYLRIGEAQGHRFGEGEPGSPAPDFNLQTARPPPLPGDPSTTQADSGSSAVARRRQAESPPEPPPAARTQVAAPGSATGSGASDESGSEERRDRR